MTRAIHGTAHGKIVKLDEGPDVADGQEVEVQMKVIPRPQTWGDGIRRSAGGWANYPEMDAIMHPAGTDARSTDTSRISLRNDPRAGVL